MPIKIPRAPKKQAPKVKQKTSKKFLFQSPKGMHDILPSDFLYFDKVQKSLLKSASFYGFERIETPILEDIKLFERGTGLTSEVVGKQMFVVKTKGKEVMALRPEMTPGVLRAYIQNGLSYTFHPGKFYYFSPLFRYEQPQHGRFRQFYQLGFEVIGSDDAVYDALVILATLRILSDLKLKNVTLKINSIGCKTCRSAYVKKLKDYYKDKISKMCRDCSKRFVDNPLRILDCKQEKCQPFKAQAPWSLDYLCSSCKNHFKSVLEYLDEVKVPYLVDYTLVRGLDYYSRTVFEVFVEGLDFALGGGGRYDYLSETLGGPKMAAVGAACGVERIVEALKNQGISSLPRNKSRVFLVYMGDQAKKKSVGILETLYDAGIPTKEAFSKDSLKAQLKAADKEGADLALILGQQEAFEDVIIVRDMKSGTQETIPISKMVEAIKKRLK
jgi:histidyl-tRNA synthetase